MAQWHFLDKNGAGFSWDEGGSPVSSFDDGLAFMPGEDGFSADAANAKAAALGKDVTAEYTGTPNWHERIEAEQRAASEAQKAANEKAAAEATIDAMLHPVDPKVQAKASINAQYDDLLSAAPDRSSDIESLRRKALSGVK